MSCEDRETETGRILECKEKTETQVQKVTIMNTNNNLYCKNIFCSNHLQERKSQRRPYKNPITSAFCAIWLLISHQVIITPVAQLARALDFYSCTR